MSRLELEPEPPAVGLEDGFDLECWRCGDLGAPCGFHAWMFALVEEHSP